MILFLSATISITRCECMFTNIKYIKCLQLYLRSMLCVLWRKIWMHCGRRKNVSSFHPNDKYFTNLLWIFLPAFPMQTKRKMCVNEEERFNKKATREMKNCT
jgi:hypothetical protein